VDDKAAAEDGSASVSSITETGKQALKGPAEFLDFFLTDGAVWGLSRIPGGASSD
jgi:hypothetical protein